MSETKEYKNLYFSGQKRNVLDSMEVECILRYPTAKTGKTPWVDKITKVQNDSWLYSFITLTPTKLMGGVEWPSFSVFGIFCDEQKHNMFKDFKPGEIIRITAKPYMSKKNIPGTEMIVGKSQFKFSPFGDEIKDKTVIQMLDTQISEGKSKQTVMDMDYHLTLWKKAYPLIGEARFTEIYSYYIAKMLKP